MQPRLRKLFIAGLATLTVVLAGCQSTQSKQHTDVSSSKKVSTSSRSQHRKVINQPEKSDRPTSSAATKLLEHYTQQTPEDTSTRSNDGEVTYSQFYFKNSHWNWRLTSRQRGVIADGQVLSVGTASDTVSKYLRMKSSSGTNYRLSLQALNDQQDAYTVKTSYQNINGFYIVGDTASAWTKGVPSKLIGTWMTNFYPANEIDGSDSNNQAAQTRFFIGPTILDGVNSVYTKAHTLVAAGAGWGANRNIQYKKISDTEYWLKAHSIVNDTVTSLYKITYRAGQIKISGTPTMHRISTKPNVAVGYDDNRAKDLTTTQLQNWIARHADDTGHTHYHGLVFEDGRKNHAGELVVQVREDNPDSPVDASIGFFKVSKEGQLEFSHDDDHDASWRVLSDNPDD